MTDQLISFETAILAKEKGFNEPCYDTFMGDASIKNISYHFNEPAYNTELLKCSYSAPTQSLLQRWLREIHKIHIVINYNIVNKTYLFCILNLKQDEILSEQYLYFTYEETLEKALQEALEFI